MTTISSAGVFSVAPQAAKLGETAFDPADYTWYRYKAMDIDFGLVEDVRVMPLEIGGVPVPTGAFKGGLFVAGGATLQPRMEGDLGWLLYGLMGSASSVANQPEAGLYTHIFRFNPSSPYTIPWMAARKHIPGEIEELGELGWDCKVVSARFAIPQSGQLTSRVDLVGRKGQLVEDPAWTYADAYEDYQSIPTACCGYFKWPELDAGAEQPVVGLTIDATNGVTGPDEERIIGSYYPDDFAVRTRNMMLRLGFKWNQPDMYQRILTALANGTSWSPAPFMTNKSGAGYAFEARAESPANIPGKNYPYSITFRGGRAVWMADGSPRLVAGGIVMQNYVGQVIEPASGEDYAHIVVVNEVQNYTWPS